METSHGLSGFLRARRELLKPADVGLPDSERRRVEGLRREEVAQLAGVSASWYTLFETARDIRVSPRMLQSVSQALRLSREETIHLFSLAIDEMPIVPRNGLEDVTDPVAATRPRQSREPDSYVVPAAVTQGPALVAPTELANYIVAHSEYSGPLMRRNALSALVGGESTVPQVTAQPIPATVVTLK